MRMPAHKPYICACALARGRVTLNPSATGPSTALARSLAARSLLARFTCSQTATTIASEDASAQAQRAERAPSPQGAPWAHRAT